MSKEKDKGYYYECRTVEALHRLGYHDAVRVPASGSMGRARDDLKDDVTFSVWPSAQPAARVEFRAEAKMRKHGWNGLRGWLKSAGILFLWSPRCEPLVVMTEAGFRRLLEAEREAAAAGLRPVFGGGEIA